MTDVMPKTQSEYIRWLQGRVLEATNMTEVEAWRFAFRVWQLDGLMRDALIKRDETDGRLENHGKAGESVMSNMPMETIRIAFARSTYDGGYTAAQEIATVDVDVPAHFTDPKNGWMLMGRVTEENHRVQPSQGAHAEAK